MSADKWFSGYEGQAVFFDDFEPRVSSRYRAFTIMNLEYPEIGQDTAFFAELRCPTINIRSCTAISK